ncbi:MAG TPA: hypothetical protein VN713_12060 [Sphingomicrobium sp.]|nr:hypothetical protein [Sphingomicrobium sp.]
MPRKHFMNTLRELLAADEPADAYGAARYRWLHRTAEAWQDANRRVTEAWFRTLAPLPDDISDEELEALDLPDPPEQAEVDALWAQLNDVIQKDLWPRHLYFGGI